MSVDRVRAYFEQAGFDGEILLFDASSATVPLAAIAVGCEEARIAKTLSFLVKDAPVLIVAAGDARVDNRKFKDQFGAKAKKLTTEQAETLVGHAVGGVCPFAVNPGVSVYLDESLRRFESVYPACGSANSAVKVTLDELERLSHSLGWVAVCGVREPV